MHATRILLGALVTATTAFAYQLDPTPVAAALQARNTEDCERVARPIFSAVQPEPTTPPAVAEFLATATLTVTDLCKDAIVTGDIASAYSSYASDLAAWRSSNLGNWRSIWLVCSDVPEIARGIPTAGLCSTVLAQLTAPAASTTATSRNAAPRETGLTLVAAAVVAGLAVVAV